MKARYFFRVIGITIFSLLILNSIGMAQIHYDNTGNVGIGTTSPAERLDVNGTVKATAFNLNGDTITSWPSGSGGGDGHSLDAADGDPADVVYVDNNGNVGIGTSNPLCPLHVTGTTAQIGSGNLARLILKPGSAGVAQIQVGTKNRPFRLSNYNGTHMLTIDTSNGNVGIGTTAPGYKLHVDGDIYATGMVYGANGISDTDWTESEGNVYRSTGNVGIGTTSPKFKLDVDGRICAGSSSGFGEVMIRSNVNNTDFGIVARPSDQLDIIQSEGINLVSILDNGNVGIGTTSPSYKLHVNGTAYATGAAGALSDRRSKTNINDLSFDALEVINALRPVTFEWKEPLDSGMEGTQLGFIAQEVEGLLPEAVLTQDNEEQTKGLKYNALIPLLTKAIQELKAQNETLKAENNSLRYEIEQIKEAIGL